ncbi:MAG: DMT family transporter [Chloroflexota bacterium]|nr:MAG: DMT family transporter [Chloroflexota bacterium]
MGKSIMTPVPSRLRGAAQVLLSAAVWGSLGVAVRQIDAGPITVAFYRVIFAAAALALLLTISRGMAGFRPGKYLPMLAVMGLFLSGNWLLFLFSLSVSTVATTVLAFYTYPIFVGLLAPLIVGERLERTTIYALVLAMLGVFFTAQVGEFGDFNLLRVLPAIGAGLSYALMVLLSKRIGTRLSAYTITFWETFLAIPFLLIIFLLFSPQLLSGSDLGWAAVVGVVHTAFTTSFYLAGQQHIKAQYASVLAYVEPVSAAIFAAVFLGEIPTLSIYLGGALILAASVLVVFQGLLRSHRPSAASAGGTDGGIS